MTAEYRNLELQNATQQADAARAIFNTAKPGSKKWRTAASDLEFWTNKKAYLQAEAR